MRCNGHGYVPSQDETTSASVKRSKFAGDEMAGTSVNTNPRRLVRDVIKDHLRVAAEDELAPKKLVSRETWASLD